MVKFYIGIPGPYWITKMTFPFMISRRSFRSRKKGCVSNQDYAIDSGGFSELSINGKWEITEKEYVGKIRYFISLIEKVPNFISQMDWMCEPHVISKTGLSVKRHQINTVENYIRIL